MEAWRKELYNELYHEGTKGMHWGVRRYQYKDGSLTPAGRRRYLKGEPRLQIEDKHASGSDGNPPNRGSGNSNGNRMSESPSALVPYSRGRMAKANLEVEYDDDRFPRGNKPEQKIIDADYREVKSEKTTSSNKTQNETSKNTGRESSKGNDNTQKENSKSSKSEDKSSKETLKSLNEKLSSLNKPEKQEVSNEKTKVSDVINQKSLMGASKVSKSISEMAKKSADAERERIKEKMDLSDLSNDDLKSYITRYNLEKTYKDIKARDIKTGQDKVSEVMNFAGDALALSSNAVELLSAIKKSN